MKNTKKAKLKWVKLGICCVDSGCIRIQDPCLENGADREQEDKLMKRGHIQLSFKEGGNKNGVVVQTMYGDGFFPVWGFRNSEGRIEQIRIDL